MRTRQSHQYLARRHDGADAAQGGNLVLLEQVVHATDIGRDRLGLVVHHLRQVQHRRRNVDTQRLEAVPGLLEELGSVQQGLGGNATDIEAGAPQRRSFLDHRNLHPKLRRTDRRDIAARTRADDGEIERICHL